MSIIKGIRGDTLSKFKAHVSMGMFKVQMFN